MEKNTSNLQVISLASAEPPKFVETTYNDWVLYGKNNQYPQYLLELVKNSPMHGQICSSKTADVCGNGLEYKGETNAKADAFIEVCNVAGESLNDVYKKCAFDLVVYNGFAFQVNLSKDKKSIAEVYHIDFSRIRSGKMNDDEVVEQYYVSRNWKNWRSSKNMPAPIDVYNPNAKEPEQMIYDKDYFGDVDYYPVPTYCASTNYIEVDTKIGPFHNNNIDNGMSPSYSVVMHNGDPSPEEKDQILRDMREQYAGSKNAGKLIVIFAPSKEQAPVITPLQSNDSDKQFLQLQETTANSILIGHKITSPILVGITKTGGLGNNAQELQAAWELYNSRVIGPLKQRLLKQFNKIMKRNGLPELFVVTTAPITFTYSEATLMQLLTKDEMRANIGLEPIAIENETPDTEKEIA